MTGALTDLSEGVMGSEFVDVLHDRFGIADISAQEIWEIMGTKRTNANTLDIIDRPMGTALFPVYPLMNRNARVRIYMCSNPFMIFT